LRSGFGEGAAGVAPRGRPRALVIGGSIGGLFAARALRAIGWEAVVFERTTGLEGRGTGIVTHDALIEALRGVGVQTDATLGVPVTRRQAFDLEGQVVCERIHPQTVTSWERLFNLLRAGVAEEAYRTGHDLVGVDLLADGVRARFAHGSAAEGDLLVAADGFRSTVRRLLMPEIEPAYAGYVGWRGLAQEEELNARLGPDFFDRFGFFLGEAHQMVGYPVAGAGNDLRPGRRRYNFVWYRPADPDTLRDLLTDAAGTFHPLSIPPPLLRAEAVAEMRASAERTLCPQFREVVRATSQPFFQPIYDVSSPRLVQGRVALLGDAAFVARPHVGAGVTKAAEDALALADALAAQAPDAALRAYERERLATGARIVAWGRRLGGYIAPAHAAAPPGETFAEPTPAAFMAESASLEFLRT
jgi:2-polyprenyl-6-methoxyphenol hydroxylase-like FAD-dependent oxidoreductase